MEVSLVAQNRERVLSLEELFQFCLLELSSRSNSYKRSRHNREKRVSLVDGKVVFNVEF